MSAISSERLQDLEKARKVLAAVFAINVVLSLLKLICGFSAGLLSMAAEGFHSMLDAAANAVSVLGLSQSLKPPDDDHPYGHRKFEALSAIAISFFMFLASFEVCQEVIHRVLSPEPHVPRVAALSYFVIITTMIVNLLVSKWEEHCGKKLKCGILLADGKHSMSDLWASVAVLSTLIGIQLRFHALDTICSLVIVLIILRAGYSIIMAHLGALVDEAVLDPQAVERSVLSVAGVSSCHKVRSRGMVDHIFIDLHVQVPSHLSIEEAHSISFKVEEKLRSEYSGVAEILVHLEDDSPKYHSADKQERH